MAPTKLERRAFSPFSSVVPSSKICVADIFDVGDGGIAGTEHALISKV
jgi:hypothetical protein